jgi:hypothetical protein
MIPLRDILLGLGLPAVVSVALAILARSNRHTSQTTGSIATDSTNTPAGHDATGLALLVGYLLAHSALLGAPPLPPTDVIQWLYFAAIAMLVLSIGHAIFPEHARFRILSSAAVFVPTIWVLVRPLAQHTWTPRLAALWAAGLSAAAMLLLVGLDRAYARRTGVVPTLAIVIVAALAAAVLLMSGSQTYGQLAAALPAAMLPALLIAAGQRPAPRISSFVPSFVLLFGGLLLCGHLYATLTTLNALLLFVAPLGIWAGELPRVHTARAWQRAAVQLVATITPAAIATGLALSQFLKDMAERSVYR